MFPPIPENTIRAARAMYGKGNRYLRLGDQLNSLVSKFDPNDLVLKQDGSVAIQLGLLTLIQYTEELTDIEMTDALQRRHDLKYALHLDVTNPRIYPASLCGFRRRILSGAPYQDFFAAILSHLYREISPDPFHGGVSMEKMLYSICQNTIRKSIVDAMFHSLEALSADHFDWLRKIAPPHWYERYSHSVTMEYRFSTQQRDIDLEDVNKDIQHLLREIGQSNSRELAEMPEIKNLISISQEAPMWESTSNCSHCINLIF